MKIFPTDKELLTMSNILLIYSVVIELKELNAVWAMNYGWVQEYINPPYLFIETQLCFAGSALLFREALGCSGWEGRTPAEICVGSLRAVPNWLEAPSQQSPAAHVWHPVPRLHLIANCNKCLPELESRGICVSVGTGRDHVRADFIPHSPWELPWVLCHLAPMDFSVPCCSTQQCRASFSSGKKRDLAQMFLQ